MSFLERYTDMPSPAKITHGTGAYVLHHALSSLPKVGFFLVESSGDSTRLFTRCLESNDQSADDFFVCSKSYTPLHVTVD